MADNNFRFQLRSGSTIPTAENLLDKELGYSTSNKRLYINNNDDIQCINGIFFTYTINLDTSTEYINIKDNNFYEGAIVFIDIDYSKSPTAEQIKAFRKADLVQSTFDSVNSTLTLTVKGSTPTAVSNIPLKVVVF